MDKLFLYSCVLHSDQDQALTSAKRFCTLNKIQIISELETGLILQNRKTHGKCTEMDISGGLCKRKICEYRDGCRKVSVYGAVFQGKEV